MSDVSPGLESQGCHLIPLCYLLSCSSVQSCYPFCLIVFCLLALSSKLFQENSSIFFVKRQASLYGSCLAVRRSELVSGMCSMLPYDIGIFYYAFIYIFFYCFCPFLFYTLFLKSCIGKSREWSTKPACRSLMCFFKRGDTKGTNSSKILCSMFVYVLFYVNLCRTDFVVYG